jgi:hypothetical protein
LSAASICTLSESIAVSWRTAWAGNPLPLSARTRALNVDDLPVLRCTPVHQTIKAQPDYQRLWELSVGLAQGTFVREPPRW